MRCYTGVSQLKAKNYRLEGKEFSLKQPKMAGQEVKGELIKN